MVSIKTKHNASLLLVLLIMPDHLKLEYLYKQEQTVQNEIQELRVKITASKLCTNTQSVVKVSVSDQIPITSVLERFIFNEFQKTILGITKYQSTMFGEGKKNENKNWCIVLLHQESIGRFRDWER